MLSLQDCPFKLNTKLKVLHFDACSLWNKVDEIVQLEVGRYHIVAKAEAENPRIRMLSKRQAGEQMGRGSS